MPKVSVIIATYNRASLLQRAIESVLSQTFQHFEIIIVDDGSTDTTAEVVETYRHPKIRYIRHSENRGKSVALNNGLESAKGEYIAFLDDDDLWLRHKLQLQVDVLEKSDDDVGIVFSGRMSMDEDGGILEVIRPKRLKYHPRDFLLHEISILASTVLAKKKYLSMVGGFDEAITNREDLDVWIRLSEHCRFKPISEPLVKCLHAEESLTRHAETAREGMLTILNKNKPKFSRREYSRLTDRVNANHHFLRGRSYFLSGDKHKGMKEIVNAIKLYHWDRRYYLWLLSSLFGIKILLRLRYTKRHVSKYYHGLSIRVR